LLTEGITVLQSDTDSLLLKNPITSLVPYAGDLVGQRGSYPPFVTKKWGASLSFGFIRYSPTPATMAFIELGRKSFARYGHDQRELQDALNGCTGLEWNLEGTGSTPLPPAPLTQDEVKAGGMGVADYGVSISPLTDQGDHLKIVLLPNRVVPRRCESDWTETAELFDHAIAAHCYRKKKMQKSADGFYFLKPDWFKAKILPGETAAQFFIRIGIGHPAMSL
jgi:hypothetical protein